jgi:hypothetical protein
MVADPISRDEFIRKVLYAYSRTPGTTGIVRRSDRLLASKLHQQGVSLIVVENALVLAAARRLLRAPGSPPLAAIRSLAYFSPVIDELLATTVGQEYFRYLRHKIERFTQITSPPAKDDNRIQFPPIP